MSVFDLQGAPCSEANDGSLPRGRADSNIVILGLGNVLFGDDGAGIHVITRLRSTFTFPPHVQLIDGGTLSFTLLDVVESCRALVVVDAMSLDAPPGRVRVFVDAELDQFLAAPMQRSVHDANLGDLLRMCALRGTLPEHRVLVGIQPEALEWQESPSGSVAQGIQLACSRIDALVKEWA